MTHHRTARSTLCAVEMDVGDELLFTLANGQTRRIVVKRVSAGVFHSTLTTPKVEERGAVTNYRFTCVLEIDGVEAWIVREVGTQKSFYEPNVLMGMRIWFDTCDDIFNFLTETHGKCRGRKKTRCAIQDASLEICPTLLHPWCPLPEGGLRIEDCYNGEDCWLGAYFGCAAHGGLDINHPSGTPIYAPFAIDDHYLFDRVNVNGANNNRWRGFHKWADGSTWVIQVHHVINVHFPEHTPIEAGAIVADGAGVLCGSHEHSHFVFKVIEPGATEEDAIFLDPWILFWQMYRDRARVSVGR